jgi:hypothetical protein
MHMNPFEMVVLIVGIVMLASVLRARYGYSRRRFGPDHGSAPGGAETQRLRDEVTQLKERIKVLERITVEKENSLAKEIESLRDR